MISSALSAQDWQISFETTRMKQYEDVEPQLVHLKDQQVASIRTKAEFSDGKHSITVQYLRCTHGQWEWAFKSQIGFLPDGKISGQTITDDSKLKWAAFDPPTNKLDLLRLERASKLLGVKK